MASEFVAYIGPADFQRETDLGNDLSVVYALGPGEALPSSTTPGADIRGLSLPKYQRGNLTSYGYTFTFRVPLNLTMGTGLTFVLYMTDDGNNAIDLGTVVVVGLTLKRLAANATVDVDASGATEVTANATLSSTSAGISKTSIAIANASLPSSLAVGDLVMGRLRRVGTSASDTCQNRVLLYAMAVNNT
jgi:hypothetical protein